MATRIDATAVQNFASMEGASGASLLLSSGVAILALDGLKPTRRAMMLRMRHGSRNRSRFDALQPRDERTWLVTKTMAGELLHSQPLDPFTDLRTVLDDELERRRAAGWIIDEPHSSTCAAFFAERDGVRVGVMIVQLEPGRPLPRR